MLIAFITFLKELHVVFVAVIHVLCVARIFLFWKLKIIVVAVAFEPYIFNIFQEIAGNGFYFVVSDFRETTSLQR